MKLLKFSTAASVAALFAGAASAQLQLDQATVPDIGTAPMGGVSTGSEIGAAIVLADELDIAAAGAAGELDADFGFELSTNGNIPPGQNVFLTIELTNGVFADDVVASDIVSSRLDGAVVDDGGQEGDASVRFLLTTADTGGGGAPVNTIPFLLPIQATGCDLSVSITEFATETAGTSIEGGSASLAAPAVTCDNAFAASLVPDGTLTQLLASADPAYSDFTGPGNSSALGVYSVALTSVPTTPLISYAGGTQTAAALTDVDGYSLDVVFEDATGIETVGNTNGTVFAASSENVTSDTVTLTGAGGGTGGAAADFVVTIDDETVMAQNVDIESAILDLDADAFLNDEAFLTASVEPLTYDGQYFGPFDWVADANGLVNNIFRVTGLPGTDVVYQVIVENSSKGESFNGVFTGTLLGSNTTSGEARLNRTALTSVAGEFGTADISMVFNTPADLDVDRLMASPMNAVVSSFGDGANSDGTGAANPTTPLNSGNNDDSRD